MHGHEEQPDDSAREPDDLTDEQIDDEMLLEALVNRQLPAHIAIAMCQRLETEPELRKQLANIVSSQALLASVLDPTLRPTTPECDSARARFGAYADQTLAHGEISTFSAHLQGCSLCQLGFEAFEMEREDALRAAAKRAATQPVRTGELRLADTVETPPVPAARALPAAQRGLPAPTAPTKSAGLRAGSLAAACVAIAVTAFASGRWTAGVSPVAVAGKGPAAAAAASGAAAEVLTAATSAPDLAAAVAELLAMNPWTPEQRAVLTPLADPNLGADARRAGIDMVRLSGWPAPENLRWALAACEASPAVRAACYSLRTSDEWGGRVDVGQALRALDPELARGAYAAAGRVLGVLARAPLAQGLRPILLRLLERAVTAPAAFAADTNLAWHAVATFPGDAAIRAAVGATISHRDARVRVLALGALAADAARMRDDDMRVAALCRLAPYLADADPTIAARARSPFREFATTADLAEVLKFLGGVPPPQWDALGAAIAARVAAAAG